MTPYQRQLRRIIEAEHDQCAQVAALLSLGVTQEEIRRELGITTFTFALHKQRIALVLGPQRVEQPEPCKPEPEPPAQDGISIWGPQRSTRTEPERLNRRGRGFPREDLRLPPGLIITDL